MEEEQEMNAPPSSKTKAPTATTKFMEEEQEMNVPPSSKIILQTD